jgi:photosystem II stability/assembly factor-like uncharacterized protein
VGGTGTSLATVLFNTNGGAGAWSSNRSIDTVATLYGIHFLNANNGWVVGSHGIIRKTIDGGVNWTKQTHNISSIGDFRSVHFVNSTTGYAVGPNVFKTTNGGSTDWILQSGTVAGFYSVSFPDTATGYAVGQSGVIFKLARPTLILRITPRNHTFRNHEFFWMNQGISVYTQGVLFDLRGRQLQVQSVIPILPASASRRNSSGSW